MTASMKVVVVPIIISTTRTTMYPRRRKTSCTQIHLVNCIHHCSKTVLQGAKVGPCVIFKLFLAILPRIWYILDMLRTFFHFFDYSLEHIFIYLHFLLAFISITVKLRKIIKIGTVMRFGKSCMFSACVG